MNKVHVISSIWDSATNRKTSFKSDYCKWFDRNKVSGTNVSNRRARNAFLPDIWKLRQLENVDITVFGQFVQGQQSK